MKIFVPFSLLVILFLIAPYILHVDSLECRSQYGECALEIKQDVDSALGLPIKHAEDFIYDKVSQNPKVESVQVYYQPIAGFRADVIEKKGEVAVLLYDSSEYLLLDREGKEVNIVKETQLPKIIIEKSDVNLDSEELSFAISLLIELAKYHKINEIKLRENSINAVYSGDLELIFPQSGDIDVLLGSLEILLFQLNQSLRDLKIEDTNISQIKSIDLRYNNPVVR